MAMVLVESFDLYNLPADLTRGGWSYTNVEDVDFAAGRLGSGRCLVIDFAGPERVVSRGLPANYGTAFLGFALNISDLTNTAFIFRLRETATTQVHFRENANGSISVYRGATTATLLGTTAPGVLLANTWHYVELRVVFSSSAGAVEIRVDGSSVLSLTSINTISTANAYANLLTFAASEGLATPKPAFSLDDFYINDTTGSANNGFLGEVRMDALYPTSDVSVQFTPTGAGATNAARVGEARLDTGTFVASDTVGHVDRYGLSNLPHSPVTVYAVAVAAAIAKNDAGARTVRTKLWSGATLLNNTAVTPPTTTSSYNVQIVETDPNTSAAWTAGGVNALEAGIEIVS